MTSKVCVMEEEGNRETRKEPLKGSPKEAARTKTVFVIKRKNVGTKQRLHTSVIVSRGIPKPGLAIRAESVPVFQNNKNDDDYEKFVDDSVIENLPSDALVVIQALLNNYETSIMVPLLPTECNKDPFLKAVLECQVHNRLRDSSSSSELQELFDSRDLNGSLIQLRAPSNDGTEEVLSVILTTNDYIRGVYDARGRHRMPITIENKDSFLETAKVVEWFVKHVRDWTGQFIRDADVEESFRRDPVVGFQGHGRVMEILQTMQLVLPSHDLHAYQLWLPTWGIVLKSWQEVRWKILANIKRSYRGEKSLKSLKQTASPIPVELIIEWLKEVGVVYCVNRPSGVFIRLSQND